MSDDSESPSPNVDVFAAFSFLPVTVFAGQPAQDIPRIPPCALGWSHNTEIIHQLPPRILSTGETK